MFTILQYARYHNFHKLHIVNTKVWESIDEVFQKF